MRSRASSSPLEAFFTLLRQPGGWLSLVGHGSILLIAFYTLPSPPPLQPAVEASAVDVISEKAFQEMMKGDKASKIIAPTPERRVDHVQEKMQDNPPDHAKKDVASPQKTSVAEPLPPTPSRPPPPPPKPAPEPPAKKEISIMPPLRPELREVEDKEAEIVVKKNDAKPNDTKVDDTKLDVLKKMLEDKKKQEDKKQDEEKLKQNTLKRLDDLKKLEDQKKLDAELKQRDEKAKKERALKEKTEENKLLASINAKLQTSKEVPSASGASGAKVAPQSTAGTTQANGARLSPSERSQLVGLLTDQMSRCLSIPPGVMPKSKPIVELTLGRDGAIINAPRLLNPRAEPGFMPYAEANMRALRNCAPFRIPARFLNFYDDWKNLNIGFDPSDL